MKTNKRILIILMIFLIAITITTSNIKAFNPDDWKPTDDAGGEKILNIGNTIVGVIQVIGIVVSVAIMIVLGIKYIIGSVEEKATYKKTMIPYLIGAIFLFGASAVAQFLFNIAKKLID